MTESNESYQNDNETETVWDFIRDNPRIVGIPIADGKGLDILNALRDVWKLKTTKQKDDALTVLADVILSMVTGSKSKVLQEVLVQEAMITIDEDIEAILDEGR